MTPAEKLRLEVARAEAQLRVWGQIMVIEDNPGWLALQESFLGEAARLADEILTDTEMLAAKGTDAVTLAIAVMGKAAQWRAALGIVNHVKKLKRDAGKAEAFLDSLKTRE